MTFAGSMQEDKQKGQLNVVRTQQVYLNMRDPRLLKYYYRFNTINMIKGTELEGSSPPDIFVGHAGYPNVYIGPLVPPQFGDTSLLASPEQWVGKSIIDIVAYRSTLVRGMFKANIAETHGRLQDMLQELAIADKYTYAEMELKHKPNPVISLDENGQPFGPSAQLRSMEIGNTRANKDVERAFFDTDMTARTAMLELYDKGVQVTKIQKAVSAGVLGMGENRKFVPTRWSITAVDDTISKTKLESIKEYPMLDSIRIYETVALDNRWLVLMAPGEWSYELIEAWYPDTTWNLSRNDIAIYSSHEFYGGRKTYAEIGGCYYAARLAVSELLERVKAQAKVVILRETHSGYILPVGVWNVREHVRQALRQQPRYFSSMNDALAYVGARMEISVPVWIRNSTVLQHMLYQRTLR
ncbi:MAG: Nre family DNA repair protein [Candidatus Micrarchaeia archaeon]